ncbi:Hypothetical predicted protein [Paramuricea clavata]|uniref:Uncharacterized protein n=1 Tax=Paramuricea clavata TaxID=317549 RepID=A0A7D9ES93_PARCT|nr:Hypothetical predicted protein [Paramuricea clavata]
MAAGSRFARVDEEEINQLIDDAIPKKWLHLRYPFEELENLSKEILAERPTKFYQELKQDDGREYSRSAHVAIRAGINRYLTSERVGKTFINHK